MTSSVVLGFPPQWRFTAEVTRPGGTDPRGNPLPGTVHEVPDCMASTQSSVEEPQSRSDAPETVAWLLAPVGADVTSVDRVDIPDSPLWPSGRFQVSGEPDKGPLGVRVPLRRP